MDDSALVRRVNDFSESFKEWHELLQRHPAALTHPAIERGPVYQLHRNPQQPILLLDTEGVDVCRIWVIELGGEPRFTEETLDDNLAGAQPVMQDLDYRLAAKKRLLAAIDRTESAFS